jgi:hypothetical protein
MAASIARRVRLGRKVCRSGECFAGLGGSVRKVTAMKTILVLLVFSIAPLVSTAATPASPSPLAHLTFRDIGPAVAGGRVTSIAGIPGQPGTYVVGWRRRLEDDRRRRHLDPDLRTSARRLCRGRGACAVEPEHHLGRHRRSQYP